MTFDEILERATRKAGSESRLARLNGWNHNAPRTWRLGVGLPSTRDAVAGLARFADLTIEEVAEAVWAERRRRMERREASKSLLGTGAEPSNSPFVRAMLPALEAILPDPLLSKTRLTKPPTKAARLYRSADPLAAIT